ncbi:12245_t:CDS:1, partial [Entrophospora sp. SA101]
YTGKRTKNIGNYNHIGMERHWASHCTGNSYCGVSYDVYLLKIKQKSISGYIYDNEHALHQYGLWMQNAIRRVKHAREIGRKIRAVKVIQQKWLEYFYRPDGLCDSELALHYQLLWAVREEMQQVNN